MWLRDKPKRTGSDYSKTSTGVDLQPVCQGCGQIEILLDLHHSRAPQKHPAALGGARLPFHTDFAELAECARKCHTCRVFRQGILSRCGTNEEVDGLAVATRGCAVFVRIKPADESKGEALAFKIEIRDHPKLSTIIQSSSKSADPLNLPETPHSAHIARQAIGWLKNCRKNHTQSCAALRWSSENPTRLIHIISDTELRLCSEIETQVKYAALSYCWGSTSLTEADLESVKGGMTTFSNLGSRTRSFQAAELPATLRDAITLIRRIGVSHVWIDSVCIIQDESDTSDFMREAPRMHSYYGNALFTLAVCSNHKATAPVLVPRSAFSHIAKPCHLRGRWLTSPSISLGDALGRSPLMKRAWTLQEQHLSPRILYWTSHRMYWSCAGVQLSEAMDVNETDSSNTSDISRAMPQSFLLACNRGTAVARHREWQTLVASYSLRDMSNLGDLFPALSGLASRYQSSSSTTNTYLAGLWESTLAQDLAWRVVRVVRSPTASEPAESAAKPLPSWTWASLPLRTGIEYENLELERVPCLDFVGSSTGDFLIEHLGQDDIAMGSAMRGIRVCGRLRPFWHDDAHFSAWPYIVAPVPLDAPKGAKGRRKTVFTFEKAPERNVYSAEADSGMIVAYEARRQETAGQLDYITTAERVMRGEVKVYALQLTEDALLLVEPVDDGKFRRVGMADHYRAGFFEGIDVSEVELV